MPTTNLYSKVVFPEGVPTIIVQPGQLPSSDGNLINLSQYSNSELRRVGWYRVFEPSIPEYDDKIQYIQYSEYFYSSENIRVERTISVESKTEGDRLKLLSDEFSAYINGKITNDQRQMLDDTLATNPSMTFQASLNEVKGWITSVLDYRNMKAKIPGSSWD